MARLITLGPVLNGFAESRMLLWPLDVKDAPEFNRSRFLAGRLIATLDGRGHQSLRHPMLCFDAKVYGGHVLNFGLPLSGLQVSRLGPFPLQKSPSADTTLTIYPGYLVKDGHRRVGALRLPRRARGGGAGDDNPGR
jgi:hypothetical protein